MADGVARALLPGNLMASVALVTDTARDARRRHRLAAVSASLLGQGLAGGVLLASLQKGESRINLQLECDGPLAGFFVDAGAQGQVRGYVKNPGLDVELGEGPFRWRAALGNSGFLSVLRDVGEDYYRSSIQLEAMSVAADLARYFQLSDQVPTRIAVDVEPAGAEGLGVVAGALVQALPDATPGALDAVGAGLTDRLAQALRAGAPSGARALLTQLFPAGTVTIEYPVSFGCSCSKQRVLDTLATLGAKELQDIVDTLGSTAVTCHFCGTKHEVSLPDLLALLEQLHPSPKN